MILESEKMPEERRERVHRNKADGHVMKMWVSDRSDEEEEVEQVEDSVRNEVREEDVETRRRLLRWEEEENSLETQTYLMRRLYVVTQTYENMRDSIIFLCFKSIYPPSATSS